ncbi:hypothetical protein [[Pseudomonas] boreopolis]|uniref:Uncharacterized protein n=1 Tax=Xanthomonas boreopolis TaxID=86183 RepID=A0A919KHW2_9XANT|nr:hypothetical protein GCM10009090_16130 [[Pseudomonas] boreopolis]
MTNELFHRPPRRMLQPTKDQLREHIAQLAEENIRLRADIERLRTPWWQRIFRRKA